MNMGNENFLMRPDRQVGIVGYGGYIPRYRLPGTEVSRVWTGGLGGSRNERVDRVLHTTR